MMKKILACMLGVLILFSVISVNAEDLNTINFTSDKYEIERGEEVVLTIASNDLTAIEANIKYDTSVWTILNDNSQNSFTLNEETGKFALANLSGEEKITATITLKSKENTTVDSSTIKILDIKASNKSGDDLEISDKEVTIKFKKGTTSGNSQNGENPNDSEYKEIPETNNKPNAQEYPKTGKESIFMGICTLAIVSGIIYIYYRKNNF